MSADLWVKGRASPALARLTSDRFLTGCIPIYHLDGVLEGDEIALPPEEARTGCPQPSTN